MKTNFKRLLMWKKSCVLVTKVYRIVGSFPSFEKFGLSSQLQRSAVSVPSNIAEGAGRRTNKDFARFIDFSIDSSCEMETQLYIAYKLGYVNEITLNEITSEIEGVRKMMY